MTTIATDGVTIAADGQESWGNEAMRLDVQKIIVMDNVIYALSGANSMLERLIEWEQEFFNGAKGAPPAAAPDVAWTLLVIRRTYRIASVAYISKCPYPSPVSGVFALGSGADYAVGAMHCGKTPAEAVALVRDKRLDVWTGGDIQVVNIAEALGLAPVREAAE